MTHEPITLFVVEDHEMTRSGIIYSLTKLSDYVVIGEACNGIEALEKMADKQPNVVLMDIVMPTLDGIHTTQQIKALFPSTKVIMLTSHQDKDQVMAAMTSGADAYCIKDIATENLIDVIRMVHEGACWLDPKIASIILSNLKPTFPIEGMSGITPVEELTSRELAVLKALVKGMNNQQIAETLNISIHTVKTHFTSILQKLAVDDRTQAALKALRLGIVLLD